MAQEVILKLVDDLDATEATETVLFGVDGEDYEIDLSAKNAAGLRKALERYVGVARQPARTSSATRGRGRPKVRAKGDVDPKAVRAWATESGIEISTRGRIPSEILDRYKAAGNR